MRGRENKKARASVGRLLPLFFFLLFLFPFTARSLSCFPGVFIQSSAAIMQTTVYKAKAAKQNTLPHGKTAKGKKQTEKQKMNRKNKRCRVPLLGRTRHLLFFVFCTVIFTCAGATATTATATAAMLFSCTKGKEHGKDDAKEKKNHGDNTAGIHRNSLPTW